MYSSLSSIYECKAKEKRGILKCTQHVLLHGSGLVKLYQDEAGEKAPWLRTFAALSKDPGSIPSTITQGGSQLHVIPVPGDLTLFLASVDSCTYMVQIHTISHICIYSGIHTHTHEINT